MCFSDIIWMGLKKYIYIHTESCSSSFSHEKFRHSCLITDTWLVCHTTDTHRQSLPCAAPGVSPPLQDGQTALEAVALSSHLCASYLIAALIPTFTLLHLSEISMLSSKNLFLIMSLSPCPISSSFQSIHKSSIHWKTADGLPHTSIKIPVKSRGEAALRLGASPAEQGCPRGRRVSGRLPGHHPVGLGSPPATCSVVECA